MDSYAGNNSDPVTLHKYLYANANPVMNVDPTGNYSVAECNGSMAIQNIMSQAFSNLMKQAFGTINAVATASADAKRIYNLLQSSAEENAILKQWLADNLQGAMIGMIITMACNSSLVMRSFFAGLGMGMWANQLEKDLNSGDTSLVIFDLMQAASLLGSFCGKCFTGDTLVRTEEGFTRIDEIKVGDYVLAENVETGEKKYKKVLKVYVKETTKLVHLRTDGTKDEDQTIDTTANHPFYVEGRGWVAAEDIEAGDRLHTEDGSVVVVTANETEKLRKPIKVYNLEVEDYHTYYVTADEVLVHNVYKSGINSINSLDDLLTNPNKLSGVSGEELYSYLVKKGYDVKPLNKGSFKGIPFKEGGGFKVNWGGDRILQYHPANLSHHGGAYFKISSGETGIIRIDLDGNLI